MPTQRSSISYFTRGALVTILSMTLMELASLTGLTISLASDLPYPMNHVVRSLIVLFSLLGIYGLTTKNSAGVFFALLASVWEVVLSGFLLVKGFQEYSSFVLLFNVLAPMTLGITSIFFIYKFGNSVMSKNGLIRSDTASSTHSLSAPEYAVEVVDVVKKYFIGPIVVPAINGLSLKVKKGEFVSIMGPSGCGKSTLLNLIGALDKPTSGKIFVDGVDISALDQRALAKLRNEKIGFVFQAYNLINRSTVFRNVELPTLVKGLPKEERERKVKDMLEIVGLPDKSDRKPRLLSGGEQQRVAIARALVNQPSIILADEPTGNLDSKSGKAIISFMREQSKKTGTTIVVVTHDPNVAEMTDRIVYLKDGKIIKEEVKGMTFNEV